MKFNPWCLVRTQGGVYKRLPYWPEIAALIVTLLLAAAVSFGAAPWLVLLGLVPLLGLLLFRLNERLKYGRAGRPVISVVEGMLCLPGAYDMRGNLINLVLRDLQQLVVYGPPNRRVFRFIRGDRTFVEAAPLWNAHAEQAAVGYLEQFMAVNVVFVEEASR